MSDAPAPKNDARDILILLLLLVPLILWRAWLASLVWAACIPHIPIALPSIGTRQMVALLMVISVLSPTRSSKEDKDNPVASTIRGAVIIGLGAAISLLMVKVLL